MYWYALLILAVAASTSALRSVCYYTNWAQYRAGKGKYVPEDIDPNLCTHVIYAFGKLVGNAIQPFEWNDDSSGSKGMYERTMALKQKNPKLKVLLAIGGYNMGTEPFTKIAATPQSRSAFVQSAIKFLRDRNFDGLDLDWEYPAQRGSPATDKHQFTLLAEDLRKGFDEEAKSGSKTPLMLTGAFAAGKSVIDNGYEIPALAKVLDFISLMTYDLHGSWDPYLGMNSPLYAHATDTGDKAYLNVDWAAQYYVKLGAPKEKLNIGIGTYGRSFRLSNAAQHGVGSAASGAGEAGQYTRENGFLSYYEVCDMIKQGAKVHDVPSQGNRYLVKDSMWVGYDDVQSVQQKACYARSNGYGGIMFWALDLDDFNGQSCGKGKYPLITSAVNEFRNPTSAACKGTYTPGAETETSAPVKPETTTPKSSQTVRPETPRPQTQPAKPTPSSRPSRPTRPSNPSKTTNPCSGLNSGFVAHPTDCTKFYQCAHGTGFEMSCPPTLLYNAEVGMCDIQANVPNC